MQSPQTPTFDPTKPFTVFDPTKPFKLDAPQVPAAPESQAPASSGFATIGDVFKGVGKSVAGVVEGGGNLLRQIPGVQRVSEAIGETTLPFSTQPTNTAQAIGKGAADIAQFFTPTGVVGKSAKAAEVAKNVGLTLLQGGGTGSATFSGLLTAFMPTPARIAKTASGLQQTAEKEIVQALGPTKDVMKATATKIAPQILERGVRGSREAMLERASSQVAQVGREINSAVQQASQAGVTVPIDAIRQPIVKAASQLFVTNPQGEITVIEGMQPVVRQLTRLGHFIERLGPEIPIEQANRLKITWDKIVSKAGLYGNKVGAASTDNAKAWAFREASSAFRKAIAQADGGLDTLNQEYKFWKGLRDVLSETTKRTQAQGGGLSATIMGASGAGAGAMLGGDSVYDRIQSAAIGGLAGRQFVRLMQSPTWRTSVSAPMKHRLADALASDSTAGIALAMRSIMASLPSVVRQQFEVKEP